MDAIRAALAAVGAPQGRTGGNAEKDREVPRSDETTGATRTAKVRPRRVRDRRERIIAAAAELVARQGYHAVAMEEIGAAAGITGPAIYRHFSSKAELLVTLYDQVVDRLMDHAVRAAALPDERAALGELLRGHVDFALDERELISVYLNEGHSLPADDRRRLRRKQRLYIEEWVHVLAELRPDLSDGEVRAIVHGVFGVLHSVTYYDSGIARDRLRHLLTTMAWAILGPGSTPS